MARFFLDRPVFAWVVSIIITLLGLLALNKLSVTLYPALKAPRISIYTQYKGASADSVRNSVTSKIEQYLTGIEGMRHFTSESTNDGSVEINVSFEMDADAQKAYMDIQNKVQSVQAQLPESVRDNGVFVVESGDQFSTVVALSSEKEASYGDIGEILHTLVVDEMSRLPGVARARPVAPRHAMRIWLDPLKLARFNLSPSEVLSKIQVQNSQVAAGYLGDEPVATDQPYRMKINVRSLLETPEEFSNIVLKSDSHGGEVLLKDIAAIEIGYDNYVNLLKLYRKEMPKGQNMGVLLIYPENGGNLIEMENSVKAKLKELRQQLPPGMHLTLLKESSTKVKAQLHNVVTTMVEAVILVFVIMYLFLQSFRATLVPAIAVPIVLVGSLSIIYLLGYSINTFTMYALILAIGLLVDDAIVVVENVERVMAEQACSAYEATRQSMEEISSALVGIGLSISAVFMPMAFMPGTVGIIFQQFSVTLIVAMLLSVVVAMTLSPVLCASLLKPELHPQQGFFALFNRSFVRFTNSYANLSLRIVRWGLISMLSLVAIIAGSAWLSQKVPSALVQKEDSDTVIIIGHLKPNATYQQAREVSSQLGEFVSQDPAISQFGDLTGFSGTNMLAYVRLKDISTRTDPSLSSQALIGRIMGFAKSVRNANVFAFSLPELDVGGSSDGIEFSLVDARGQGAYKLLEVNDLFTKLAENYPQLDRVRVSGGGGKADNIYQLDIDREKLNALHVPISSVDSAIRIVQSGAEVNDYVDQHQIRPVIVQGAPEFRRGPDGLLSWYTKNEFGEMISFKEFMAGHFSSTLSSYKAYNGYLSLGIEAAVGEGYTSGEAIEAVEQILLQLPKGYQVRWRGAALEEKETGSLVIALYAISALFVFLVLAALYESWTIPFSVMLAVPFGIMGALIAVWLMGMSNDLFFKVAIITTMALTTKNAILIIEFANQSFKAGTDIMSAVAQAVRLRLRPIIMTSMAFGLGVLPLATATGVGSIAQHSIGIAVLGGMLLSTFIGTAFVPLFFVIIVKLRSVWRFYD